MKELLFLKVLDRFQGVFKSFGCDYPLMRKIIQVKLIMDGRRVPTIMNRARARKQSESNDSNAFLRSLWTYLIMGLILIPFVIIKQNDMFSMSIASGILMFLVMTAMISDFSNVLLDIRDRFIITTKPIDKRTISFARTLHIIYYLVALTGTLAGPSLVAALYAQGILFFLVYVLDVVLLDLFILVITALLYLVILHFFDGERLKDIINYFQIILSFAIVIGYQLVGRSFSVINMHIEFREATWQWFVPPFWFGAAFEWLMSGKVNFQTMGMALAALVIPLGLFFIYLRMMPLFERQLQKLSAESSKTTSRRYGWMTLLMNLFTYHDHERHFFRFAFLMMARERDFKLKVYPSLGFSAIIPFIVILSPVWSQGTQVLSHGKWYLWIYMSGLVIPTVMLMLRNSSQYGGAWVYLATPIKEYSAIYKGTIKAALTRLYLPVFLLQSIVFFILFGWRILPDLIVVCLSMWLYAVITFRISRKALPFSEPYNLTQQADRWTILPLLLLILVFALIHFLFSLILYGVDVYALILLFVNWLVWNYSFRVRLKSFRFNG